MPTRRRRAVFGAVAAAVAGAARAWNATRGPLEYCPSPRLGRDGPCERLRVPATYGAAVFLDDGATSATEWRAALAAIKRRVPELVIPRDRPGDAPLPAARGSSMGVKFRNFRRAALEIRWDDGTADGVYSGVVACATPSAPQATTTTPRAPDPSSEGVRSVGGRNETNGPPRSAGGPQTKQKGWWWCSAPRSMGRTATMTYAGHAFFFVDQSTRERVARFEMVLGRHLYVVEPDDEATRASAAYADALAEVEFTQAYLDRTGTPWLSYYPRAPPALHMWPADFVGQAHVVYTPHGPRDDDRGSGGLAVRLTALSHAPAGPRVFLVEQLLTRAECGRFVELGEGVVRQSRVGQGGGFESKTRTSANGWLARRTVEADATLGPVYARFADVLGLDPAILDSRRNAEELQIVRYDRGQEYAPHHDFGDDGSGPAQRFLTLLVYLALPMRGGATSFPKALGGRGLEVKPAVGDAVLFYNALPDGNADDRALHAGMPVLGRPEGGGGDHKWVTNLWVWDPHR